MKKLTFKSYARHELQKVELKDLNQSITIGLAMSILEQNNYKILCKDDILFQTLYYLTSIAYQNKPFYKNICKKIFRKDKYHKYNFITFTALMIENALMLLEKLFDNYIVLSDS